MSTEITPRWNDAPNWAQYWTVDDDGNAFWWRNKPVADLDFGGWAKDDSIRDPRIPSFKRAWRFRLPVGFDWTKTLHQRPEDN